MLIQDAYVKMMEASFKEMLNMLPNADQYQTKMSNPILDKELFFSSMITVASPQFKILVILHAPKISTNSPFINALNSSIKSGQPHEVSRNYDDYICELCNNLSGACARMLRNADIPTGLSTPAILTRPYGNDEIMAIGPTSLSHMTASIQSQSALSTSFCLQINSNQLDAIDINLRLEDEITETSGELEFF
ncbi:hypothetical protein P886_4724 [Alteromonadaceae bacterium 2753L.S.0a.02]|nr:hypothetical protein P886_4724 [Alteromonadaceae bacterium 2753L.S.0a.02]